MIDCKLLVLDLDGTLTNAHKEITPRTLQALQRAQRHGVRIVLASGRPTYGIAPLAEQLQLQANDGYVLAFNGGLLIHWSTQQVLFNQTLPAEQLPYIYKQAQLAGMDLLAYQTDFILTEQPESQYVAMASYINKMPIRGTNDFLRDVHLPVNKLLILGDEVPLHTLEERMKVQVGDALGIYRSQPTFLEVVPAGIDKAETLHRLVQQLDIDRELVVAMGDGWNDISMLQFAGHGVAMANAVDEVKAITKYTTLSNEEDGVAYFLEKYVL